MSTTNLKYIAFLKKCLYLKRTVRTGWTYQNVNQPESVADHSYQMALMALTFPEDKLPKLVDRGLAVQMCIVHDLPECIVTDLAPKQMKELGITKEKKHEMERNALFELRDLLKESNNSDGSLKETSSDILLETLYFAYENQSTPTAKFVKDLDRLEMCIQASFYQDIENRDDIATSFYGSSKGKFNFKEVDEYFKSLTEHI